VDGGVVENNQRQGRARFESILEIGKYLRREILQIKV
jgi:hypothetical protein